MNIGLLENNPTTREWITIALELMGHRVSIHTTGASFLEALTPGPATTLPPYDRIIVDLDLPNSISGIEVIMRIRSTAFTEKLPLLILSDTYEQEAAYAKAHFPSIPILHKPFRLQDLTKFIDQG